MASYDLVRNIGQALHVEHGNPDDEDQCRMQHFFKPRPLVQRELLPLLLRMQKVGSDMTNCRKL